ncbi:hypothetical protein A9Z40_03175 [Microbacterium arborescens]|uniref:Uncharacterized protein n=1 Tax=Microbacterium arborescens TaxID=33883 RepID=A0ABX2WIC2_9MICO|nr:hypothetical protein [Microbacterium arborescens]OAZ40957.1 hypothetical protein A9Z40_03175 [Microbacterium arborescens]
MTNEKPDPHVLILQDIAEPSLAYETVAEQLADIGERVNDERYAEAAAWLRDRPEPEIPSGGVEETNGFVTVRLSAHDEGDAHRFEVAVTTAAPLPEEEAHV